MKNIFILIALLISTSLLAQRPRVTGPRAKNYKPWENKIERGGPAVTSTDESELGPRRKNSKPWREKTTDVIATESDARPRNKGPRGKNYKPWIKD